MKLSETIKDLRIQRNLRQEQLAEAMGVSTASVSKWETGQCAPELTILMELADFFEVSVDTLLGHTLNSQRLESLMDAMDQALKDRCEEQAATLCGKILRNYPNQARAVEACSDCLYRLYVFTDKKSYMEQCIAQTRRLMALRRDEPERTRLERLHRLGNQYEYLNQWDDARACYEQSNVNGSSDAAIAGCLLSQGKAREAVISLSDVLVKSVFSQFQVINKLVDGWVELGEPKKGCAALKWLSDIMESLRYAPSLRMLVQVKLVQLYASQNDTAAAQKAMVNAARLVRESDGQTLYAQADFLLMENAREILISGPGDDRALLLGLAEKMGEPYTSIVREVLA